MKRMSVCIDDDEADSLRRWAARTGKPQAELIREGIRRAIQQAEADEFLRVGAGEGTGDPADRHWTPEEVYAKVFPDRQPAQ